MAYKDEFIRFMAECGVLKFGDFTLKSGRKAPYFINTGEYKKGSQLEKLGGFYADCNYIEEIMSSPEWDSSCNDGFPVQTKKIMYCCEKKLIEDGIMKITMKSKTKYCMATLYQQLSQA